MNTENNDRYYRHSGRLGAAYFPLTIIGIFLIAVLSFLYALVMFYNHYVYLNVLITFGVGALIGLFSVRIAVWGKVRNKAVNIATLVILVLVFVYVHFTVYAVVVYKEFFIPEIDVVYDSIGLLTAPADTISLYLTEVDPVTGEEYYGIIADGVWGLGENPTSNVTGVLLVLLWTIEHVIVVVTAGLLLKNGTSKKPFFEQSGKWGVEKIGAFKWEYQQVPAHDALKGALESVNPEYFRSLSAAPPANPNSLRISCFEDPSGISSDVYLSLYNSVITFNNKGQMTEKKEYIVQNLLFPADAYSRLEQIAQETANAQQQEQQQPPYEGQPQPPYEQPEQTPYPQQPYAQPEQSPPYDQPPQ